MGTVINEILTAMLRERPGGGGLSTVDRITAHHMLTGNPYNRPPDPVMDAYYPGSDMDEETRRKILEEAWNRYEQVSPEQFRENIERSNPFFGYQGS